MYRVEISHGNVTKIFDLDEVEFKVAHDYLQDRTLLGGKVTAKCIDAPAPVFPDGVVFYSFLDTLDIMYDRDSKDAVYSWVREKGFLFSSSHMQGDGLPAIAKYVEPGVRYTFEFLSDAGLSVENEDEAATEALYKGVSEYEDFKLLELQNFDEQEAKKYDSFTLPWEIADRAYRIYRRGERSLVLVYWGDVIGATGIFIVQFDPV